MGEVEAAAGLLSAVLVTKVEPVLQLLPQQYTASQKDTNTFFYHVEKSFGHANKSKTMLETSKKKSSNLLGSV